MDMSIIKDIQRLKEEKNAVILAHNYQPAKIYQVADFVGDSLELAKKAKAVDAKIIVFCGVRFMAETAKILNPGKKVLLAAPQAGCQMADMVDAAKVRAAKSKHPKAVVACYVNTTAQTKTECDVCVTSANAIKVVSSLKEKQVIFVPDKNLGAWVEANCQKDIILVEGFCYVHNNISVQDVEKVRKLYPEAPIMIHPESRPEVVALCDFVCSTSQMIAVAKETQASTLVVGTELGMIAKLEQECPNKTFVPLKKDAICADMKLTSLKMIKDCLKKGVGEISLEQEVIDKARGCIDKMLSLS